MDFPFYSDSIPYDILGAVMAGMIIGLVIGLAIAFVFYIFNAIGLYKISKNRGYKNAWLAFIPVVNSYVLGAITDNINACYTKKSAYRMWLLILNIITCILSSTYLVALFGNIPTILQQTIIYGGEPNISTFASMFLVSSLMGLAGIATLVLTCICWYKIYADYSPNNATLFLVLSILFKIAPFFIFAIRNKPSASLYFANQRTNQAQPQYQNPQQPQYQNPQQPQYQTFQQPQYQAPQQPQYQAPQQPQYQAPQQPVSEPVVEPVSDDTAPVDDKNDNNIL